MRSVLVYWIIGTLLVGANEGLRIRECPDDRGPTLQSFVLAVAIWPAAVAAFVIGKPEKPRCKSGGG